LTPTFKQYGLSAGATGGCGISAFMALASPECGSVGLPVAYFLAFRAGAGGYLILPSCRFDQLLTAGMASFLWLDGVTSF
jgi:hypothetical protein